MIRKGFFALLVVLLFGAASAQASPLSTSDRVTNTAHLDDGTCGRNLQIGSDINASSSSTPDFILYGDGGLSSYKAFIDGAPIGTFNSDGFANVCVTTSVPLADGPHELTANELQPHSTYTIVPYDFTVDTVPPAQPSTPVISGYSDSGLQGDHMTKYRNVNFTGFSDPNVSIQLYNGPTLLGGAKASATGTWSATTSTLQDGNYVVTATAIDQAGNRSQLSLVCPLTIDGTAPTGNLTSPTNGSIVTGTVNLAAAGSDANGIWKVDFQVDGVTQSTTTTTPFTYAWNSASVANGNHTLTAIIHDFADNTVTSTVTVTVQNGGASTPGAPTLNSATGGSGSVALNWSAPASTGGSAITGYKVYRGTSSGGETLLTTLGNQTSYTDTAVTNGTTYYYRVSAVNGVGEGVQSNEASAIPAGPPGAPTLTTASGGSNTVALAWNAPAANGGSGISGYKVYRGTSSGGETLLTTLGNLTSWSDTGVSNGTTYYYKVTALNSVGEGSLSNELSATPQAAATIPGAPTLNSASAGNTTVALSWSAPASNGGSAITGYKLYRGSASGGEALLATLGNQTSYNDTGLTNGSTYYYKVSAVNGVGEGSLSGELSATPGTVPAAPTLNPTSGGNGSVTLNWTAGSNGGGAITGYKLYRATTSGGETLLATLGNQTSYTDNGLTNGSTYYYKVSAVNAFGEGPQSGERSATPGTVPGAPTLNSATAGNNLTTLAWSAPSSNGGSAITGYKVYRGTASGGETLLTTLGNVTGWTDTSVLNGTTYFYKVTAINGAGESAPSNEASAIPAGLPGTPTLNSANGSSGSVTLSWSAAAANGATITNYRIYRSTTTGGETLLTTVGNQTSYTDTAVTNGTTYYYKVSAMNSVGEGGLSGEKSATPSASATVPGAPTLNSATGGNGTVALSWSAPASDGGSAITNYRIYRGSTSGGEGLITTVGNQTTYNDVSLVNGVTYYYEIVAVNGIGAGGLSNERSATPATVPGAPTLNSAGGGNGTVALSWTSGSNGGSAITGYRIYRGTASGGESLLTTLGSQTSWTDSGVTNGTTYYYKVTALNSLGESAASGEQSATPAGPPGAPTFNSATAGSGSIALAWSAPSSNGGSAITGYRIYRGTASGGEGLIMTLGNVTSWTDTSVTIGSTYYYKVSALNSVGESALSSERSATPATVPAPPTVAASGAGPATVNLSWAPPSSNGGSPVTGYRVYRGTSSGGETQLVTLGNVNSYSDGGLSNGTTYYYKVTAINAMGEGLASNEVSATPATTPGAPTLSPATGGTSSVSLSWSAPANGGSVVTAYKVYRGTSSNGETLLTTLGAVTSYTDSSVAAGTTYYYKVSAVNAVGEGALSVEQSATPGGIPGAPTLNALSPGNGSIGLSWNAPAANGGSAITSYRIYRSTTPGSELFLAQVGNVTSYTDSSVTNGTTYYYVVSAVNSTGEGLPSAERSATLTGNPGAPTLTSANAATSAVSLAWNAPSSNGGSAITGYKVYRGTSSGGETLLTTLGAVTSWNDTGVATGTTYYYKVTAVNTTGEGLASNEMSATPAGTPGTPTLTATAGNSSVGLSWTPAPANGSTVTNYRIYRSTTSGAETLLTTVGNITGYTDSTVANGTTYYYKVTALNSVGEGLASSEQNATPATTPGAPSLASAVPGNSVTLTWSAPTTNGGSAVTGYNIYRSTASGAETFLVSAGNVTTYTDLTTTSGTTYYYEVSAVNSMGESPVSNELSATPVATDTTAPSTPSNVRTLLTGTSQAELYWTASIDNVGVTGYKVYRDGNLVGTTAVSWYLDSGMSAGTTHTYTVRAYDAAGNTSAASSNVNAKLASLANHGSTGTLSGGVFSGTGTLLANALVTVQSGGGSSKSAKTNSSGVWSVSGLAAGAYTVTVSLSGYQTQTFTMNVTARQTLLALTTLS